MAAASAVSPQSAAAETGIQQVPEGALSLCRADSMTAHFVPSPVRTELVGFGTNRQ